MSELIVFNNKDYWFYWDVIVGRDELFGHIEKYCIEKNYNFYKSANGKEAQLGNESFFAYFYVNEKMKTFSKEMENEFKKNWGDLPKTEAFSYISKDEVGLKALVEVIKMLQKIYPKMALLEIGDHLSFDDELQTLVPNKTDEILW